MRLTKTIKIGLRQEIKVKPGLVPWSGFQEKEGALIYNRLNKASFYSLFIN